MTENCQVNHCQKRLLVAALEQIAIVCTDNMGRSCDHRMALDFVRQIANDTFEDMGCPRGQT